MELANNSFLKRASDRRRKPTVIPKKWEEEMRGNHATKDESVIWAIVAVGGVVSTQMEREKEREKEGISERHRKGNRREESLQCSKTQSTSQDSECICDTDSKVFREASVSRAARRQKRTASQPSPPPHHHQPVRSTKHVFVSRVHECELQYTSVFPGQQSRLSSYMNSSPAGLHCLRRA